MAHNTSVSLGDGLNGFIAAQVASGNYGSASEVMRAGVRLLRAHEAKVKALEAALIEGEMSGPAEPFDNEAFIAEMKAKYGA